MRLATLKDGGRDGRLAVVSRDGRAFGDLEASLWVKAGAPAP
jgi:hypothetical protein